MDRDSPFGRTCSCGRTFPNLTALGNHLNACKKSRKRLSYALAKVKDLLASRKRKAVRPPEGFDDKEGVSSSSAAEHEQTPEVSIT
jgi:hypothetical protein